jgi:hypothetical protein
MLMSFSMFVQFHATTSKIRHLVLLVEVLTLRSNSHQFF